MSANEGQIIAVCGLHGGAGTTEIATLLATTCTGPPTSVLLIESNPAGGGLGMHFGVATGHGLADMAAAHAAGRPLPSACIQRLPSGLKLSAAPPAIRNQLDPRATAELLLAMRRTNALTFIDAGCVTEPHAQIVLPYAQHVVWTAAADTDHRRLAALLASEFVDAARAAGWTLAINDIGRGRSAEIVASLRDLLPMDTPVVLAPALRGALDDDRAALAARQVLSKIR